MEDFSSWTIIGTPMHSRYKVANDSSLSWVPKGFDCYLMQVQTPLRLDSKHKAVETLIVRGDKMR